MVERASLRAEKTLPEESGSGTAPSCVAEAEKDEKAENPEDENSEAENREDEYSRNGEAHGNPAGGWA